MPFIDLVLLVSFRAFLPCWFIFTLVPGVRTISMDRFNVLFQVWLPSCFILTLVTWVSNIFVDRFNVFVKSPFRLFYIQIDQKVSTRCRQSKTVTCTFSINFSKFIFNKNIKIVFTPDPTNSDILKSSDGHIRFSY